LELSAAVPSCPAAFLFPFSFFEFRSRTMSVSETPRQGLTLMTMTK
jgi:hypothetical protein